MSDSIASQPKPASNNALTPQEIELKLGSPSLTAPGSVPSAYSSEEPSLLERRASNAARRQSHSSAITSGTEGTEDEHTSPLHRPNVPLTAISETEDALGSGSDAESDTSSLGGGGGGGGGPRSPRLGLANSRPQFMTGPGGHAIEPVRTSRDSGGLSENVTLKSGYLMKKGERRKAWKKRWFVLRGPQLAMYKTDKEYRLLRLIPLFDIHSVAPVELKKHVNAFAIVTPRRTYYVKADSSAEVKSWCQQIEAAKAEYAARTTRHSLDTPTGTEHPTPVSGTPIPSPRHTMSGSSMVSPLADPITAQPAPQTRPTPHSQGISIPGSSAPQASGSFAPASYATTASSSFTGGATSAVLGTSYASTTSSFGPPAATAGSRAPPNSLVTAAPAMGSQYERTGLGLHSPSLELPGGLDARLEQLDLEGTGPQLGGSANLQRATSRRSEGPGPAPLSGPAPRGRSASNATRTSSSGLVSSGLGAGASATGPGGAVSSSEDEEAYEPGYEYPSFSTGLAAPTTLGQSPATTPLAAPTQSQQPAPVTPGAAVSSGFTDPNRVILSGYLMKQGKRKTWRKRWFVLTSGMLMYSRSHMDQKYNRQIPLSSILDAIEYEAPPPASPLAQKRSSVLMGNSAASPNGTPSLGGNGDANNGNRALAHAFKVITPKRTYLVCAPSEEDEIKWLAALQCLVARRNQTNAASGISSVPAIAPPIPPASTAATSAASDAPARRPSQTGPPPVSSRPLHGRNRSVTDAARQAVRDVELRFQGGTLTVAPPATSPPVS